MIRDKDLPIYLHFWDREVLSIFGLYGNLPYRLIEYDLKLTLLSTNNWLYIAASALFESVYVEQFLKDYHKVFSVEEALIRTVITYEDLYSYVLFKQEQYRYNKTNNNNYFSDFWKEILEYDVYTMLWNGHTTDRIENFFLNSTSESTIANIADKMDIIYPKNDIGIILPYVKDKVSGRNGMAITHDLFKQDMNRKCIHQVVSKAYNILVVERFIQEYMNYFNGTIVTNLQGTTNFYNYLSHTFPLNDLYIWGNIYKIIGLDRFIKNATSDEICLIRRSEEYYYFIENVRAFILNNIHIVTKMQNIYTFLNSKINIYKKFNAIVFDVSMFLNKLNEINHFINAIKEYEGNDFTIENDYFKYLSFGEKDIIFKEDEGSADGRKKNLLIKFKKLLQETKELRYVEEDKLNGILRRLKMYNENIFGKIKDYGNEAQNISFYLCEGLEEDRIKQWTKGKECLVNLIKTVIEEIELMNKDKMGEENMKDNKNIFIVHGHNELLKEKISNWLYSLELKPIVLHRQASGGTRSIMDKIERYSNVRCAIILMTADDVGKAKAEKEYKDRARQNVIFEAGYFIGKLQPQNVIILYESGIELPGDIGGCVYVPIGESEDWKEQVRLEFYEMGIDYKR